MTQEKKKILIVIYLQNKIKEQLKTFSLKILGSEGFTYKFYEYTRNKLNIMKTIVNIKKFFNLFYEASII